MACRHHTVPTDLNAAGATGLPCTLVYLSGAPRVSTRPEAELGGPRSHVLGVMEGFRQHGWQVLPDIAGDRVPLEWVRAGSERALKRSRLQVIAADFIRLGMGVRHGMRAAHRHADQATWAYERFAAFQEMGYFLRRRGVPWILETNAPLFLESKQDRGTIYLDRLAAALELHAYRHCDVLVCVSEALKRMILAHGGISATKIVVLPNGVDTQLFDGQAYLPDRFFPELTIGFVGTLIEWQGLSLLLRAMADLKVEGCSVRAVLVGDGPQRVQLQQEAAELTLGHDVLFTGLVPREQVPHYIVSFDFGYSGQVHLKSGQMYLSPLKLYEYMAMARPVLAADYEDACRVVTDGQTGFLFEGGSIPAIKQAIRRAHAARHQVATMGAQARAVILAGHSWQARVGALIGQVQQILAAGA